MPKRPEQVNELLRKELAMIIARRVELPGVLATVTRVDCSRDLRQAKAWISILPSGKMGSTIKKLRENSSFARSLLKKAVALREVPRLQFVIDDTEKNAAEIEEKIKETKEK